MTKALKVTMAAYGIAGTLFGLSYLIIPTQMSEAQGAEVITDFLIANKMTLGTALVLVGVSVIFAARDPINNITWLRFAAAFALAFALLSVYVGLFVYEEFDRVWLGLIIHGPFAALFLVLYPRRIAGHDQGLKRPESLAGPTPVSDSR